MLSLTQEAFTSHLFRLLLAGCASTLIGLALIVASPRWRPFGTMTAGWGVVDAVIALTSGQRQAQSAERLIPVVVLSELLNLTFFLLGLAMVRFAGEKGMVRGFGQAILIQSAILFGLDGKLWIALSHATLFR